MPRETDLTAEVALWCRKLAILVRLNVPMLVALEVLAEEFAELCEMTLQIRETIRAGGSFSDAVNPHKAFFPRYARVCIVAGEHSGDLAGALSLLAEALVEHSRVRPRRTPDFEEKLQETQRGAEQPAVRVAERSLHEAIMADAAELHLIPDESGGFVRVLVGGAWRRVSEFSPELFPVVVRRLKAMANIPYWIQEPAMGKITVNYNDSVWDFAVRAIPVDGTEEGRLEMTLIARDEPDETA